MRLRDAMLLTAIAAVLLLMGSMAGQAIYQAQFPKCPEDSLGLIPSYGAEFERGYWSRYDCVPSADEIEDLLAPEPGTSA